MSETAPIKQFVGERYRFLTFSERLAKVSVDAVHRIQRVKNLQETEDSSLFTEAVNRWKYLDKTTHFTNFLKECQALCQNYKMVVHYKDKIISILKRHLIVPKTQALHALTELVSAICGDLGCDFYPYLADFFKIFTKILRTKDLEKMEWVFVCISKLFKNLWKYMLSDMENVLNMYSEFLCGEFPLHITTFAAESISFLMRKFPDIQKVFKTLFQFLESKPTYVHGISHVIASVLKGTKGRLHSCAQNILRILFQFMYKDVGGRTICKCISSALEIIADHINVSESKIIAGALLNETKIIADKCDSSIVFWYILDLSIAWCSYKNGYKVGEISLIISLLEYSKTHMEDNVQSAVLNLSSIIFLSSKIVATDDQKDQILCFVAEMPRLQIQSVTSFWQKLFSLFPSCCLLKEHFLKFCRNNLNEEHLLNMVGLIASYILHVSPVLISAKDIKDFVPLTMDIALLCQNNNGVAILPEIIEKTFSLEYERKEELYWCCLKIFNHTEKKFQDRIAAKIIKLVDTLSSHIYNSEACVDKECVLLKTCVESIAIAKPKMLNKCSKSLLRLFDKYSDNLEVIVVLDIMLTFCPTFVKKLRSADDLIYKIIRNLSHSDFNLRRISLSCLNIIESSETLDICLSAEATPATLQQYRGRLLLISKLRKCDDEINASTREAVFRFLLGNLYINLTPYWPTVQSTIAAHLATDQQTVLWKIFLSKMREATDDAKNNEWWVSNKMMKKNKKVFNPNKPHLSSISTVFNEFSRKYNSAIEVNSNPDFFTYRLLLWSTLSKIGTISNVREEIMSMFFDYLDHEHYLADTERAVVQNVTIKIKLNDDDILKKQKHLAIKTLDTMLGIMVNLKNPNAYANSEKLKTIYYSLLTHDNAALQKQALNCATGFFRKNFGELREYLINLLDDQKLKEAAISDQLNNIDEKRRVLIMPIILRILYGKLLSQEKVRSGGKGYAKIRRGIVLKFLARFSQSEIKQFMDLVLEPLACFEVKSKKYDMANIVPLSKQFGVINTLCIVTTKYSSIISHEVYEKILMICVNLMELHFQLINQIESGDECIDANVLPFLKKVSKKTFNLVSSVIEYWPLSFPLSQTLLNQIFDSIISTSLHKLKHECLNQPNALFNLLTVFAKQQRFTKLLSRPVTGSFKNCVHAIVDILTSEHVTNAGAKNVMEFLREILPEDEALENPEEYQDEDVMSPEETLQLVVPHTNIILQYFVSKLTSKKNDAVLQNLPVLKLLGKHIKNSELSQSFAELLLSQVCDIAKRKKGSAQAEERKHEKALLPLLQVLQTVANHEVLIPNTSRLFMIVIDRKCRESLVTVFESACDAVPNNDYGERMRWCAKIVSQLNAWNKRSIEEIDFDTRLTAFEEIQKFLQEENNNVIIKKDCAFVMPILHCSVHTLFNYHQDISMRECASRLLERICQIAAEDHLNCRDIISLILETCKLGVNSAHSTVRQESLRILSTCVKLLPDEKLLKGLNILKNESDPDADFFENICHLQMHRRTRALRKLADMLDKESIEDPAISHKVVQSYLTPIAVQILKTESLAKYQHLEIECLRVITSSARIMPWTEYKTYLNLTMQWINRDLISMKIICAVLQGFNVDLTALMRKTNSKKRQEVVKENVDEEEGDEDVASKPEIGDSAIEGDQNLIEIYNSITQSILPRLTEGLSAKLLSDDSHKMADKSTFTDLEQCEMRSLLALAVANVLNKFPMFVVNDYVPRILLKLLVFLRHRFSDVRQVACKSIAQIAESIGASKFHLILAQLKNGLCRGYQKHVLVYAIYNVLLKLEDTLKPGDLEHCLKSIIPVLNTNLFGAADAERDITKLTSKIPEAKGRSKALGTYKILAKFSLVQSLLDFIKPLKLSLEGVNSHKIKLKVEQALGEISDGLLFNTSLTHEDLLIFVHGIISENITTLFHEKFPENKSKTEQRESCLILNDRPERYDAQVVSTVKRTNLHVIVEFALKLLNTLLKRNYHAYKEYASMLDPLIPMLITCIDSPYNKTVSESVKCFSKLLGLGLPGISSHFEKLASSLFVILRENSKGMGSEEIASASFKTLSILCLGEHGSKLSNTQLEILLAYAESDLYHTQRQGVAFNLIKSILSRGLKGKEVDDVMDKVRKIAIQTQDNATMLQARHTYVYYLMHYSFKEKKLIKQVSFVLAQFNFEYETGRLSAMELTAALVSSFPKKILKSVSALIFVSTSTVLLNDASPKCKKFASELMKNLLKEVEISDRDQFLDMVVQWYSHKDKPNEQKLSSILIGLFAEVFGATIIDAYFDVLPHMLETIENTIMLQKEEQEDNAAATDHALFHQFNAFLEISKACKIFEYTDHEKLIGKILELVQDNLLHPHDWVRVCCSQIFGVYFGIFPKPEDFVSAKILSPLGHIDGPLQNKLEILAELFCKQLRSENIHQQLSLQIVKNLLFLIKCMHVAVDETKKVNQNDCSEDSKDGLQKILKLIVSSAKHEIAYNPHCTDKRTVVIKLCSAVAISLPISTTYLEILLEPLFRECERTTDQEETSEKMIVLKSLANEALDLIKGIVGSDAFITSYSNVKRRISSTRVERKRKKALSIIANPQKAIAKKVKMNLKKKDIKKRKIARQRPTYNAKKKRTVD